MITEPGTTTLRPPSTSGIRRPHYQPGASLEEVERHYGVRNASRLGANENTLGPSPLAVEAVLGSMTTLHRYPDDDGRALRGAIAARHGADVEEVVLGNGSGELISLLVRACCGAPEDEVLVVEPSFPLYAQEAEAHGARVVSVPLDGAFRFDVPALLAAASPRTRLCFLCTPNNPTGTHLSRAELERLAAGLPEQVVLVLDEAYAEFAPDGDDARFVEVRAARRRMVSLRSFSRAHGLAALRLGYMIAPPELAERVQQLRIPFNTGALAQTAALAALDDADHLARTRRVVAEGMAYLEWKLRQLGVQCWPSDANFLFVDLGCRAAPVYEALCRQGVIVRRTGDPQHLRITVGSREENERLVRALAVALAQAGVGIRGRHPLFARLLAAGAVLDGGEVDRARKLLEEVRVEASPDGDAAERVAAVFARALLARLARDVSEQGNLYEDRPGAGDMLAAYETLVRSTPLVTFGYHAANATIEAAVEHDADVHLLDLGIGGGIQWPSLLRSLAGRPGGPPRVRITGVDLPVGEGAGDERLREVGAMLRDEAARLGIELEYHCIATSFEALDFGAIPVREGEALVVNAAFALHHVADLHSGDANPRDRVLRRVRALSPRVVVMVEPDVEHNALAFVPRLRESLGHYSTVFEMLDTVLPRELPERRTIEREFFGREVLNIVTGSGAARVERHERRHGWRRRLVRAGFEAAPMEAHAEGVRTALGLEGDFVLVREPGALVLQWRGVPLIAATAWRPRGC